MSEITTDCYWAAIGQPDDTGEGQESGTQADFVAECTRKVENYKTFYGATGLFDRDKRAYMNLYGLSPDGNAVSYKVTRGGKNGQLTQLAVNQWGNLIQHQVSLITAKRPGLETRAINTDTESMEQSKLGGDVIEHQVSILNLEATTKEMVKTALAMRECWLWTKWDRHGGEVYASDDMGNPVPTGSLKTSLHLGQDVIRDVTHLGNKEQPWIIVQDFVNRWDLIADFPERKEDILAIQRQTNDAYRVEFQSYFQDTDQIPVFQLYHRPTPALPKGRQATFLMGDKPPLLDGPLGYGRRIPVIQMSPARIIGTPFGYSPMHDLLALQTIYTALVSGMVTNEIAFAVRRLLVPRGQPISATQLSTDLGVVYYDPQFATPAFLEAKLNTEERLEAINQIERLMQTLSGVNDVLRGNGEGAGTKAASGLALLQNNALQFLSGLEFEYGDTWKRWGELCLAILRERATAPQMIAIVGKNKEASLRSFSGNDLANSYRVTVDLGDPMAKTAAGRDARAQFMAQQGMLGPPGSPILAANYFEVEQTGTLQRVMDEATAEQDLIERENEAIMRGEVPPVSEFDTPALHQAKHAMVAYHKESREQAEAEQSGGVDMMGKPTQPSPILSALRQHMLLHRMKEQQMAAVQNAQAATLATQQMQQAPALPPPGSAPPGPNQGPPGAHPPPGPHKPTAAGQDNPAIKQAQPAQPPRGAMPLPGVGIQ